MNQNKWFYHSKIRDIYINLEKKQMENNNVKYTVTNRI
jgi:hypothetical protein